MVALDLGDESALKAFSRDVVLLETIKYLAWGGAQLPRYDIRCELGGEAGYIILKRCQLTDVL